MAIHSHNGHTQQLLCRQLQKQKQGYRTSGNKINKNPSLRPSVGLAEEKGKARM